jgi:hypothetical protein
MTTRCLVCNASFAVARRYLGKLLFGSIAVGISGTVDHPLAKAILIGGGLLAGDFFVDRLHDAVCPGCRAGSTNLCCDT